MKIFIANTHSVLNSGDAGIVLSQLEYLKNRFPGAEISLSSRTPEIDRKFYLPMGVRVLSPLFSVPSLVSGFSRKTASILKGVLNISARHALLEEIKNSDLVISTGGGYFWSHRRHFTGPMFYQNYLPVQYALRNRKPVIFFPQSFGPIMHASAESQLRRMLENESVVKILSREMPSFRYLHSLLRKNRGKIELCPDMAFKLEADTSSSDNQTVISLPHPIVALTLRQWRHPGSNSSRKKRRDDHRYFTELMEFCRLFHQNNRGSVVLFSQSRGPGDFENDRIVTQRFHERLSRILPDQHLLRIRLDDITPPAAIIQILKQVDILIATRFHSAIFAFIAGTPAVSIAYQSKSRGIMSLLDLSEYNVDITDFSGKRLWQLSRKILDESRDLRLRIRRKTASLRADLDMKLNQTFDDICQ